MLRALWNMIIERLPLPSSFRASGTGFGPRSVGGDPLLGGGYGSRSRRAGYADDNRLIDELDDDWGEEGDDRY